MSMSMAGRYPARARSQIRVDLRRFSLSFAGRERHGSGLEDPMRCFTLPLALLCLAARAAEPISLFDGQSLAGWTNAAGGPPGAGWVVQEGAIHRQAAGGDLYWSREVGDFDFRFEFKIAPKGNSGVKYRVATIGKEILGPEYQVLDDAGHPDAKVGPTRQTASFYDIKAPSADKPTRPAGEWNEGRIVAKGTRLEHWLNGVKVAELDTASDEWKALKAKSKFRNKAGFGESPRGRLFLQDHGDKVWYRRLQLTEG
jgi:hypothetical protein